MAPEGEDRTMGRSEHANYWTSRRVSRRRALAGAGAGVVSLGLAGCAGSAGAPAAPAAPAAGATTAPVAAAPTAAATVAPKYGGTIRTMGTAVERNLEVHIAGGISATLNWGPGICYNCLLTYKWGPDVKAPSYIVVGELAESWTQPDELTYVFKLRPGVKWHNIPPVNGRELVADDIIYSYNRVREFKSYAAYLAGITKMEAVDKSTLKFTLDKPNADALNNLGQNTLTIVAKERVEQTGGKLEEMPMIGTGPFILDSFTLNQRALVKRNPDYFMKGLPYLDAVESLRVTDPTNSVNAMRTGDAQVLASSVTAQMAEDIKKAVPNIGIQYIPLDRGTTEIMLNYNLEIFKDVRVRQAISKAIDRKAIIDAVWLGHAELTTGLSLPDPSYVLPADELNKLVGRDVEGAKRLLQQAGVTNLSFEILTPNYLSGAFITLTELIQANLKDVGVNATLKTVDTATWSSAQQAQNYQANTGTFAGAAPNGWLYARYYTGGGQNNAKYSDAEMDRLIDQQAVMGKDPEGRKKILLDIQRKIINDAVYIPLVLYHTPYVSQAYVKGFYPPAGGTAHSRVWDTMWLDK
jgi:peptide/nickel transport system substrate-binding protein